MVKKVYKKFVSQSFQLRSTLETVEKQRGTLNPKKFITVLGKHVPQTAGCCVDFVFNWLPLIRDTWLMYCTYYRVCVCVLMGQTGLGLLIGNLSVCQLG